MKLSSNYLIMATTSIFGSIIIWFTLFILNNKSLNIYSLVIVPVFCVIVSLYMSKFLSSNYAALLDQSRHNLWVEIFIRLNVYLGVSIGVVLGVAIAWVLFLLCSLLFGNLEESSWGTSKTLIFELLMLVSTIASTVLCVRYFFKSGISYINRKNKSA